MLGLSRATLISPIVNTLDEKCVFCPRHKQTCGLEQTEPGWIASGKAKIIVSSFLFVPRDRGAKLAKCDIAPPNVVSE